MHFRFPSEDDESNTSTSDNLRALPSHSHPSNTFSGLNDPNFVLDPALADLPDLKEPQSDPYEDDDSDAALIGQYAVPGTNVEDLLGYEGETLEDDDDDLTIEEGECLLYGVFSEL